MLIFLNYSVFKNKSCHLVRQTSISQIVDNQAPSDGRMDVGRCQLPLPRFSTCRPVEKRFRETYISLANKCVPLKISTAPLAVH